MPERELADEALYYTAISPRLGERFVAAVEAALELAAEFLGIGSPYKYQTRRVYPKKFQFSVLPRPRASPLPCAVRRARDHGEHCHRRGERRLSQESLGSRAGMVYLAS